MILLAARLLLAAVFAVAAVGKLVGRSRTVETLAEFGVPESIRRPAAIALPLAELAIAVALLPAATAAWAAVAAALLLAAFTAVVARTLLQGREVDCNCFGSLGPSRISRWTLARNALLLALAIGVAIAAQSDPGTSAVAWLANLDTAQLALLCAGVAIVLAALSIAFFWQLMRQNGRLLNELEALKGGGGGAAPTGPHPAILPHPSRCPRSAAVALPSRSYWRRAVAWWRSSPIPAAGPATRCCPRSGGCSATRRPRCRW